MEDVKAFQGKQDAVVIGLFKSVDSDAAKAYMSAAGGIDRLAFGISSSDEVICVLCFQRIPMRCASFSFSLYSRCADHPKFAKGARDPWR